MSDAVEIVKTLVSPCEKLISATQSAIGKAYEPRYVKRMADAKAYEIRQISQALSESSDVPIVYDKGELTMDTIDFDELVKRTQNRLAYQELRKQANIEAAVANAYSELENEPPVTSDPIDPDWLNRFFNSVEDISNEQMQYLWGKILAGEIKQPNTFSMRTLNLLRNLTQNEADLFRRISPYIITCPGNDEKSFTDYFLPSPGLLGNTTIEKHSIPFPDILTLSEAGIISNVATVSISMHLDTEETDWMVGSRGRIECYNGSDKAVRLSHSAYVLTESGKELFPIIFGECANSAPPEYMHEFLDSLIAGNSLVANDAMKDIKVCVVEG